MGCDLCSGESTGRVESDSVSSRRSVDLDLSGVGLEAVGGILGGHSALDGEPSLGDVLLHETERRQGRSRCDLDLGGDDVDTGDLLGDGVLDLHSGVDLDKVVSAELVDEELDRSGVRVANLARDGDGVPEQALEGLVREVRGGRDLDNLLVSSLDGAVSLKQVDKVALGVSENLDLDVSRVVQEPCDRRSERSESARPRPKLNWSRSEDDGLTLDEDGSVSESALCLAGCPLERVLHLALLSDDSHSSSSSSERGLDDDGEADLLDEVLGLVPLGNSSRRSRDDGHSASDGERSSGRLVSEAGDDLRLRADEDDACVLALLRKLGVLGEESVSKADKSSGCAWAGWRGGDGVSSPRVDHVDSVLEGDADDVVLGEVRSDGGETLADLVGLVSLRGTR